MGIFDFLKPGRGREGEALRQFNMGRLAREHPQILNQHLAEQESSRMSQMADQIYGNRGQAAVPAQFEQQVQNMSGPLQPGQERPLMDVNQQTSEAQAATPGTGMFNMDIPEQERMMLMNKRMLGSGLSGFNKQWSGNQGNMQNSMMSNLGSMARQQQQQKYDTANPTETSGMKEYAKYRQQGGNMSWYDYAKSLKKAGAMNLGAQGRGANIVSDEDKNKLGLSGNYVWAKDGMPKAINPSAYSDAQNKVAGYGTMMEKAEENLSKLAASGHDAPTGIITAMKLANPSSTLSDFIKGFGGSDADQRYLQSMEQWVRAKLRKESGAVISVEEAVNEYGTYFPTINETPGSTAQKRQARIDSLSTYDKESGGSYKFNSDKWQLKSPTAQAGPPGADHSKYKYRQKEDGGWQKALK